jgi:hypothetical protein
MISDMIEVVQGSLGSGKSLVATTECIYQLKRGGVVATNFDFSNTWAWDLAGCDLRVNLRMRNRIDLAKDFHNRAFKIGNPESMIKLSGDEGKGLADLCTGKLKREIKKEGGRGHRTEGKGLLVLDDCHHFFNARTFSDNKDYVAFFANARKWGWRTILITHDINNIDKQIRSYVEIESRFRNLKKVKIPYTPFPMTPFNCFVIVRRYSGLGPGSGMTHSKDLYMMDKVSAGMYNTLERFSAENVLGEYQKQGWPVSKYVYDGRGRQLPKEMRVKKADIRAAESYPKYHQIIRPKLAQCNQG